MARKNNSLFLIGLFLTLSSDCALADSGFVIVTHSKTAKTEVSRKFVSDVFLKKIKFWEGGQTAYPVDREPEAEIRGKFSQEVVGRSVSAIKSYWQQMIFSGREVPPPEFRTDEQVVKYVKSHPGAIAYVSPHASLEGLKVVKLK